MERSDPPLISVPLCEEDLWVLRLSMGGARVVTRACTLKMLEQQPLIQPRRTQLVRQYIEGMALRQGVNLSVVVEADGLQVTKDLVRRGFGATISPYSGIGADIKRGDFSGGPVRGLVISRYLVRRIDRPVTLAIAKFQEAMLETMGVLNVSDHAIRLVAANKRGGKP